MTGSLWEGTYLETHRGDYLGLERHNVSRTLDRVLMRGVWGRELACHHRRDGSARSGRRDGREYNPLRNRFLDRFCTATRM